MKKSIALVLAIVMLAGILSMSGCAAVKATNQAKELLIEYFDYYNDGDIDECVDMFGKEIEDEFENDDDMETVFNSFRYTLGEVEYFKVTSFDSNGNLNEVEVVLGVEIEYENLDEEVYEEYVFRSVKGEMEIIGIDYMEYALIDQLIAEYFENYDDFNTIKKLYIPYIADNYLDQDRNDAFSELLKEAAGEYDEHKITDYTYYYEQLDWADDIYSLAALEAEVEFDNDEFVLIAELAIEDDDTGFNYFVAYPKDAYKVITEYYDIIMNGNENKMKELYESTYYDDLVSYDDWAMLTGNWFGGFGNLIDYEILEWEYGVLTYNGQEVEAYKFYTYTYFDAISYDEEFIIIKDKTTGAIIDHWMDLY